MAPDEEMLAHLQGALRRVKAAEHLAETSAGDETTREDAEDARHNLERAISRLERIRDNR